MFICLWFLEPVIRDYHAPGNLTPAQAAVGVARTPWPPRLLSSSEGSPAAARYGSDSSPASTRPENAKTCRIRWVRRGIAWAR